MSGGATQAPSLAANLRRHRCVFWLLILASSAWGAESFDHRGSLGLLVSGGGEFRSSVAPHRLSDSGLRGNLDLGGTLALGSHWSLLLQGRVSLGALTGLSFYGGFRNFWGDVFKTFFDLTIGVHALPTVTIGPRVAFGVQYELSSVVGLFTLIAAQFGGAVGLRFGVEAMAGFQFRTYVL